MRLKSIQVTNYKGFRDSRPIPLGRNWTVVVGRNNAGKSALLEAFDVGNFTDKPHRSITHNAAFPLAPQSRVDLALEMPIKELEKVVLNTSNAIWIPVPDQESSENFLKSVFFVSNLNLSIHRTGSQNWASDQFPSHGLFQGPAPISRRIYPRADRQAWEISNLELADGRNDSIPEMAGFALSSGSYVFRAERRVNSASAQQTTPNLATDASNLAGALHFLFNNNHEQFKRYIALVREVLPEIEAVTIPPIDGGRVEIRVWNNGYYKERPDLAIPLHECGTGIGQVLAILFVAATAEYGRVLVIDEPNSFLHPGASRVLMQLLRRFERHQFIITTHSPEVMAATEPDKIVVVKWESNESRVTVYDGAEALGVRSAFDELGIRLSDVYGYDAISWVEGKTEERCFPMLFAADDSIMPSRTAFVAVVNTGDFESTDAEVIWGVYRKLAERSAFAPPTISISLDSEARSPALKAELITKSEGLVQFLPRRTYENYLLHPGAIAAAIKAESAEPPVPEEVISKWIDDHRGDTKYFSRVRKPTSSTSDEWRIVIDAPKFLGDMIGELTDHRQDYRSRKVQYGIGLTKWLIDNEPNYLQEITEYVKGLLPATTTSKASAASSQT